MTNKLDNITDYLVDDIARYSITEYAWGYKLTHKYLLSSFNVIVAKTEANSPSTIYKIGKKRMERVLTAIAQELAKRKSEEERTP